MISNRYGKANIPYMGKKYDKTKPTKFITYLDANNLYGWAMCENLPIGNFEWMANFENWRNVPCILDLHTCSDYPLAPERVFTNKVEKLIPNLRNKEKYVVHHENLKQYEKLGLKITKIHRGISFTEKPWLQSYIEKNTKLRTDAKNDFEK